MSSVRQSSSKEEYITAIENNLFAWIPLFGRLGQYCTNEPPGVDRSITDIPYSLFNSVMNTRLEDEQVEPAIRVVQADSTAHRVPILWWVTPSTQPADLGKRLENCGFVFDEDGPGMALDLRELAELPPAPAGFSIRLVEGDAALREWCLVMGWGFGDAPPDEFFIDTWHRLLSQSPAETVRAYTGWLDDKPVATSLVFLAEEAAGIYCVATIPEARRKGIGARMTHYPLLYARSQGYEVGILQSSPMGLSVYKSLGFREYGQLVSYRWKPEPQAG